MLPAMRDVHRLLGRDDAMEAVQAAVAQGGVVGLLGPGGMGKTALATAWAHRAQARVVALAGVSTERGLLQAVSRALHAPSGQEGAVEAVQEGLRGALVQHDQPLVLDNVEQITEPVRRLLQAWLAPDQPLPTVLYTSRRPLELGGECIVRLPPLHTPAAVELYRTRAQASQAPGEAIEELVEALGCNPLAIELAAAQHSIISPRQAVERLRRRYHLVDPRRGERHRSLQACVRWSWELLDPAHQQALSALCTFAEPVDALAAEQVIGHPDALAQVATLQRASLIRTERSDEGTRIAPFEAVRAFVQEHAPPDTSARERHADHVIGRVQELRGAYRRPGWGHRAPELQALYPELLQALRAMAGHDRDRLWALLRGLELLRGVSLSAPEARDLLDRYLPADQPLRGPESGWHRWRQARLLHRTGSSDTAGRLLERELHHAQGVDRAWLLAGRSDLLLHGGRPLDALEPIDQALALLPESAHDELRLELLRRRGTALRMHGDYDAMERVLEDTVRLAHARQDVYTAGLCLQQIGLTGPPMPWSRCRDALRRAAVLAEQLGPDQVYLTVLHLNTALAHAYRGEPQEALEHAWVAIESTRAPWGSANQHALAWTAWAFVACHHEPVTDELLDGLRRVRERNLALGNRRVVARIHLGLATAFARSDRAGAAAAVDLELDRAEEIYTAVGGSHGLVDVGMLRVAAALARRERDAARAAVQAMEPGEDRDFCQALLQDQVPQQPERPQNQRMALAMVRQESGPVVELAAGAERVVLGGNQVDLRRRHPARRILLALCEAHERGEGVSSQGLIDAGWPGERIRPDSARMRLHTTIRTLRQLGLDQDLQTREDGYRLSPDLRLVWRR